MVAVDRAAGLATIATFADVSRETIARFDAYIDLLHRWQPIKNLVSRHALDHIWTRHIADSAQIITHILKPSASIVDLGSGAGFPGLVMAMLLAQQGDQYVVHMIESNGRKAAFLREVIRELNLKAKVHQRRIDDAFDEVGATDYITARALAALPELVHLAMPWLGEGAVAIFHKGQDVDEELKRLSTSSNLGYEKFESVTDPAGTILKIKAVKA